MNTDSFYAHPQAIVESDIIGTGTRIWEFSHVMKDAVIGAGCNIGAGGFIENGAAIGNNVVIKNGVSIWKGVTIEDGVFIGPGVILTNEHEPRSGFPKDVAPTLIKRGASIGAGAILVAPVTIGEYATVGAGAVVTRNVAAHILVVGNPARPAGYMCICGRKLHSAPREGIEAPCECGRRFSLTGENLRFTEIPS